MKAWIIYILMSGITTMLIFSTSPVVTVINILALTGILCIYMFWFSKISIFSYVTFLIFLGGLMVLFTYMCSLASNEKYIYKKSLLLFLTIWVSVVIVSWGIGSPNSWFSYPASSVNPVMKIFSVNSEPAYLYLFIYLLLTLFVAVSLSKKKEGAMRMKAL